MAATKGEGGIGRKPGPFKPNVKLDASQIRDRRFPKPPPKPTPGPAPTKPPKR